MKSTSNTPTLFENARPKAVPLASGQRPTEFSNFYGQEDLFKRFPFLKGDEMPSLILWGPPGCGKTTLAGIIANNMQRELFTFNAVLGGVNDLKKLIKDAKEAESFSGKLSVIFIDEIHRFNKSQQDALLPFVENGEIFLIGATTEKPQVSVNRALLSRTRIIELSKLNQSAIVQVLENACANTNLEVPHETIVTIASHVDGDARCALNVLEELSLIQEERSPDLALKLLNGGNRAFDKDKDRHYDVISAFIKSVRGSDPSAALLYLAIMLDGGEDPIFIARRLIILASEDIGNADPGALTMAVSCLTAVQNIGMPEARITLGQMTTYLASTAKSNAAYLGINEALAYVQGRETIEVPNHLRNHHPQKKNYQYPHAFDGHWVAQQYSPEGTPNFYRPSDQGLEAKIKDRLKKLE
jgi:putative ATPase